MTRVVKADQVERVFANADTNDCDLTDGFWGFGFHDYFSCLQK